MSPGNSYTWQIVDEGPCSLRAMSPPPLVQACAGVPRPQTRPLALRGRELLQRSLTLYHYLPIWEVILSQSENAKFSYSPTRMSTTPPKKGKKRAPPSTPTG